MIKANEVLEVPPVLEAREPIDKVIAVDNKLKDYDSHRHVFVDISLSATDKVGSCVCIALHTIVHLYLFLHKSSESEV